MQTTFDYELINKKTQAFLLAQDELQEESVRELKRIFTHAAYCIKNLPKNPNQEIVNELNGLLLLCNVGGENTNVLKEQGRTNLTRKKKEELLRHLIDNNSGPFTRKDLMNYFNYKSFTSISNIVDSFVQKGILKVSRNTNTQGPGGRYEYIIC